MSTTQRPWMVKLLGPPRRIGRLGMSLLAVVLLVGVLGGGLALARPAAGPRQAAYDPLTWWTVDGGGQTFSSGGRYVLGGTIGQHDAGDHAGGDYSLSGGYWDALAQVLYNIYLPVVAKHYQ